MQKTSEDEAFDELAKRQGHWGGGYQAKRQMAMDKINADFDEEYKKMHEDRIKYGTAWSKDGERIDPMSVYKEQPAQEPVSFPCCGYTDANAIKWNQFNSAVQCHMCGQVYTVAQPAQEPVAWQWLGSAHFRKKIPKNADITAWNPLYTAPPKREWVGLTDDETMLLANQTSGQNWGNESHIQRLRKTIENKLKEKNHG